MYVLLFSGELNACITWPMPGASILNPWCGSQKYSKVVQIVQNWQFNGCHGNENSFSNFFPFGPDMAWLDGHFGVLHGILYSFIIPEEPKNCQKWPKKAKNADLGNFERFHGNKTNFLR